MRCGRSAARRCSIAATACPAAFRNLDRDAQEDQTRRYEALCLHYGMEPTRNNRGVAHENGSIESPHGHLKQALEDALLLRGSREFDTLDAYRRFVDEIVGRRNARNAKRLDLERHALQSLPARRTTDYGGGQSSPSTSTSGFILKRVFYSVPLAPDQSPAPGTPLRRPARMLPRRDRILMTLRRGRPHADRKHGHVVDYRHVIHALCAESPWLCSTWSTLRAASSRATLISAPSRQCWQATARSGRAAPWSGSLALAHEIVLARPNSLKLIEAELDAGRLPDLDCRFGRRFAPDPAAFPDITVELVPLHLYDELGTVRAGGAA